MPVKTVCQPIFAYGLNAPTRYSHKLAATIENRDTLAQNLQSRVERSGTLSLYELYDR